jgi:cytoskeletal protein RodZ
MIKIFTYFFVTLGVLFFCIILVASYLYIVNPNGIQTRLDPLVTEVLEEDFGLGRDAFTGNQKDQTKAESQESATDSSSEATPVTEENPGTVQITPAQAEALQALGIDPSVVTSITPEQEACFVRTLGQERVDEVKAGATPSPIDLFKAKECI